MEEKTATGDFQKKSMDYSSHSCFRSNYIMAFESNFFCIAFNIGRHIDRSYFRGLANLIHRKLHVPQKGSLAISTIGSLLLLVGFFWFAGSRIQQQSPIGVLTGGWGLLLATPLMLLVMIAVR